MKIIRLRGVCKIQLSLVLVGSGVRHGAVEFVGEVRHGKGLRNGERPLQPMLFCGVRGALGAAAPENKRGNPGATERGTKHGEQQRKNNHRAVERKGCRLAQGAFLYYTAIALKQMITSDL